MSPVVHRRAALLRAVAHLFLGTALACAAKSAWCTPACNSWPGDADAARIQPPAHDGTPVPDSALFTSSASGAFETTDRSPSSTRTALWARGAGQSAALLADLVVDAARTGAPAELAVHAAGLAGDPAGRLRILELLYSFVLRQDPSRKYRFSIGGASRVQTHGEVLEAIAKRRACSVAQLRALGSAARPIDWELPAIVHIVSTPGDRRVMARVLDSSGRPLANAPVTFARGEHLACGARTAADGIARCDLFDPHGHEVDEAHEPREATVVSFGGVVRPDRIVLPTTRLHSPGRPRSSSLESSAQRGR